jgi:hypothetical protein
MVRTSTATALRSTEMKKNMRAKSEERQRCLRSEVELEAHLYGDIFVKGNRKSSGPHKGRRAQRAQKRHLWSF